MQGIFQVDIGLALCYNTNKEGEWLGIYDKIGEMKRGNKT